MTVANTEALRVAGVSSDVVRKQTLLSKCLKVEQGTHFRVVRLQFQQEDSNCNFEIRQRTSNESQSNLAISIALIGICSGFPIRLSEL